MGYYHGSQSIFRCYLEFHPQRKFFLQWEDQFFIITVKITLFWYYKYDLYIPGPVSHNCNSRWFTKVQKFQMFELLVSFLVQIRLISSLIKWKMLTLNFITDKKICFEKLWYFSNIQHSRTATVKSIIAVGIWIAKTLLFSYSKKTINDSFQFL